MRAWNAPCDIDPVAAISADQAAAAWASPRLARSAGRSRRARAELTACRIDDAVPRADALAGNTARLTSHATSRPRGTVTTDRNEAPLGFRARQTMAGRKARSSLYRDLTMDPGDAIR